MNVYVKMSELQLADVVQAFEGPFGTATVSQIANGEVTFHRPYGKSDDFTYTGGVICYTGLEEFAVHINDNFSYLVYSRKALK